jgi:hypothetical protein
VSVAEHVGDVSANLYLVAARVLANKPLKYAVKPLFVVRADVIGITSVHRSVFAAKLIKAVKTAITHSYLPQKSLENKIIISL